MEGAVWVLKLPCTTDTPRRSAILCMRQHFGQYQIVRAFPPSQPSVISAELSPPRPLADRKKRTARKSGLMCDPATPTTAGLT